MPTRTIFLASSAELKEDREAFRLMISDLNTTWEKRGWTFRVRVWEHFLDAMVTGGLQQEYNQAVRDSDLFVMLFFTKVGPFTRKEFETAVAGLADGTGPRVHTYFRNDYVLTGDLDDSVRSLLEFKARLKEMEHYVTHYRNTEDLLFQFSQQLEMRYGAEGADQEAIDASMPQQRVGELALTLTYRQLYGEAVLEPAAAARMQAAIDHAPREVRDLLLDMAVRLRRATWQDDKRRMARTIPVFEALARVDPRWHAPRGQLGYALVDQLQPDWARGRASLEQAAKLRGDKLFHEGRYYRYAIANCAVHLDPACGTTSPSEPAVRDSVLALLRAARRELEDEWESLLQKPDSAPIAAWLERNGSPRLR
jgi:hypothetical protein